MAKNLVYEQTTNKKLKACGMLDFTNGMIVVDGEEKKLSTLFAYFEGMEVELVLSVKDKEEFDIPEDEE